MTGALHIKLSQAGIASIVSTRPDAAKVLRGKTPEQALAMVPLLFALCNQAQSYAAVLACRVAMGLPPAIKGDAVRQYLVSLETVREHVWRILMDWPVLCGKAAKKTAVAELLKRDKTIKTLLNCAPAHLQPADDIALNHAILTDDVSELIQLINDTVFGGGLQHWCLLQDESQLHAWLNGNNGAGAKLLSELYRRDWQTVGQSDISHLPVLDNAKLYSYLQQVDLSHFCRAPHWQGHCRESSPLSRQQSHPLLSVLLTHYGNGLLSRFVALMMEVAEILSQLTPFADTTPTIASSYSADGVGLAQVQAARGLLIHRVELQQGKIADYRIVAPTEWNCQPHGILALGLSQLQASDENILRQQAQWLLHAIDPCVPYELILTTSRV